MDAGLVPANEVPERLRITPASAIDELPIG
jgi:hypothetical protein